jgi:hypothetical protein
LYRFNVNNAPDPHLPSTLSADLHDAVAEKTNGREASCFFPAGADISSLLTAHT